MTQVFYCPPSREVNSDEPKHADYPHFPGTLYDCLLCESECFCGPGDFECIHCDSVRESEAMATKYDNAALYDQNS